MGAVPTTMIVLTVSFRKKLTICFRKIISMSVIWWQLIERFGNLYQAQKMSSYKMMKKEIALLTRHRTQVGPRGLLLQLLDCWTHTQVVKT